MASPRARRRGSRSTRSSPGASTRARSGSGLFKSEDRGRHWQRRLFGSGYMYAAAWRSTRSTTRCTSGPFADDGIWKSTDFGETFQRIDRAPGAPHDEYLGFSGRGIAVDPHHHRIVFHAGESGSGARRMPARAGSTSRPSPTRRSSSTRRLARRLCDRGSRRVQEHRRRRFVRPEVRGPHLEDRLGADSSDPSQRALRRDRGDGVFKSTDGGETWFDVNLGLHLQVKGSCWIKTIPTPCTPRRGLGLQDHDRRAIALDRG